MTNKKIASEVAVGIILLIAIIIGGVFWLQSKKDISVIKNNRVDETMGMANPASVFCGKNGGKIDLRGDVANGQVGYCVFANGNECEEWAYFKGECKTDETSQQSAIACTQEAKLCDDGSYVSRTGPNCEFAPCKEN